MRPDYLRLVPSPRASRSFVRGVEHLITASATAFCSVMFVVTLAVVSVTESLGDALDRRRKS